ncbi:unnamed protein product [Victoria cruziana]
MPRSLRYLKWKGCSLKMLSDNFNLEEIGFSVLSGSKFIRVWSNSYTSKEKVFTNPRVLNLSCCKELVVLPDLFLEPTDATPMNWVSRIEGHLII